MPILGKSTADVVQKLADYYNDLLARTVTQRRLTVFAVDLGERRPTQMQIAFRADARPVDAPIQTRFGPMHFALGQICAAIPEDSDFRPTTLRYRYALRRDGDDEPLFRWEYVRTRPTPDAQWCRHHLQGPLEIPIGGGVLDLNDVHLPTGYVTIEEVLRFCIVDLGVPALSERWNEVLNESYERFKTSLAPRDR